MTSQPHRRFNPLNGSSVLVSPHRTQRPWQGQLEERDDQTLPVYEPGCYLCPGNARVGGQTNPDYQGPWAFDNDFSALLSEPAREPEAQTPGHDLFRQQAEVGRCRVVCYSQAHNQSLASLPAGEMEAALAFLFAEFAALDAEPGLGYVQVFENRGAMMGCSNAHPHAQIWATGAIPDEPARELRQQSEYFRRHGSPMLVDYLREELERAERLVSVNEYAIALVPYWAVWPYELLVLPRRAVSCPQELQGQAMDGLAHCLQAGIRALNGLFDTPMPYSLGFHARPSDGQPHPEWQFHAHLYPPLLRSATIRKHMVGYEMLAMPQRDLTPELAARQLRAALRKNQELK